MKWHKRNADTHRQPHVVELYQRHGHKGLFFWDHLTDLLTEYFNFWCPGCYKFKTTIFYAHFYPYIKDERHRLIKKIMKFLNDEGIVTSSQGKSVIYIYYPAIIEQADRYTQERLKAAEGRKQEQPEGARECALECEQMHRFGASRVQSNARRYFTNKGVKR